MLVVVERGDQSQGFNSDGGRSEFEGESKVDERVCDCSEMLDRGLYRVEGRHTASDQVVNKRLLARIEKVVKKFSPIVAKLDKLIFEKIDPSTLVPTALDQLP